MKQNTYMVISQTPFFKIKKVRKVIAINSKMAMFQFKKHHPFMKILEVRKVK